MNISIITSRVRLIKLCTGGGRVLVVAKMFERPCNMSIFLAELSKIKVKVYSYLFWVKIYGHRKLA